VELYQPAIAAGLIVSKVGWQAYKQSFLKREIRELDSRINQISQIINSGILKKSIAAEAKKIKQDYKESREEKIRQKSFVVLAFGQIPSLFFDHPGSNIYQSVH